MYSRGNRNSWLLADSVYALKPYVLVPYKSAVFGSMQFNLVHSSARNIVERNIGNLKSRFRSLQVCLPCSPSKVVHIVNVCCALPIIYKHYNVPVEDSDQVVSTTHEEVEEDSDELQNNAAGAEIRGSIFRLIKKCIYFLYYYIQKYALHLLNSKEIKYFNYYIREIINIAFRQTLLLRKSQ